MSARDSVPDFDLKALAKRLSINLSDDEDASQLHATSNNSSSEDATTSSSTTSGTSFSDHELSHTTPVAKDTGYFGIPPSNHDIESSPDFDTPRQASRRSSKDFVAATPKPRYTSSKSDSALQPSPLLEGLRIINTDLASTMKNASRPGLVGRKTFAGPPSRRDSAELTDAAKSILEQKRNSLRSALDDAFGAEVQRSPATSSSPRLGILRSPKLHPRPSLNRAPSSRHNSISRKTSLNHSRASTSRPTSLVGPPSIVRRVSERGANKARSGVQALSLEADELLQVLTGAATREHSPFLNSELSTLSSRWLVIDVRPVPIYLGPGKRIRGSINANFPSLLVKRFKKGKFSQFALDSFITTEIGKRIFHKTVEQSLADRSADQDTSYTVKALVDLDLFIIDENMEQDSMGATLVSILEQVLDGHVGRGSLSYLAGSFADLKKSSLARDWLVEGEETEIEAASDTQVLAGQLPRSSSLSAHLVRTDSFQTTKDVSNGMTIQPTASSPMRAIATGNLPLQSPLGSPMTEGKSKRTHLKPIDTGHDVGETSGLGSRKSSRASIRPPKSPAPLMLGTPTKTVSQSPAPSSSLLRPESAMSMQQLCYVQSRSPTRASFPSNEEAATAESTAMPGTPKGDDDAEEFIVSQIIPGFLYLGPEPCTIDNVKELQDIPVKQILNMALEIDDTPELAMSQKFEKYTRLPMRDFVEEVNVQRTLDEACAVLDDADLKSKAIYVHCRAGKSRSVTIVLAYLIHRYHWTLKKAYAHVAERRDGISPNIGFISELMRFEERELGYKSNGIAGQHNNGEHLPTRTPSAPLSAFTNREARFSDDSDTSSRPASARAGLTYARMRESLPPMLSNNAFDLDGFAGDSEQEIKGQNGAWVHARRNERQHFHPDRRISKAGLESSGR